MGIRSKTLRTSSSKPMPQAPVDVIETINGSVQVSAAKGESTIGILVERDGLFGGTLLTAAQARYLSRVLFKCSRLRKSADR